MIRILLLAAGLIGLYGCSSYTHEHFSKTRIEEDTYTYVNNRGYNISMKTPGDIEFTQSKIGIRKALGATDACIAEALKANGNILWHGKTIAPPHYAFWIVAEDGETIFQPNCAQREYLWSAEVIEGGPYLFFLGLPQTSESKLNMKNDLTEMMRSLKKEG